MERPTLTTQSSLYSRSSRAALNYICSSPLRILEISECVLVRGVVEWAGSASNSGVRNWLTNRSAATSTRPPSHASTGVMFMLPHILRVSSVAEQCGHTDFNSFDDMWFTQTEDLFKCTPIPGHHQVQINQSVLLSCTRLMVLFDFIFGRAIHLC